MSLSFLVPAFLAGLLALAIPILVHLRRRQTREAIDFPSLMFLAKIPHKTNQRRQIHRWPLLLLRCLAVALVVLAFARPFVERDGVALLPSGGGDRELVLLVDRSYSMGMGDRWQRAVDAGLAEIDGLGPTDRGTLLLFDGGAESASESTTDRAVLRTALNAAEPGARTSRYAPALRYAARLLATSPLPRRELVIISDFRGGGWDRDLGEISSIRLPGGTDIRHVSVAEGADSANVAIAGVDFDRSMVAGRERVAITSRLRSTDTAARSLPVSLEVDDRVVETREVTFDGSAASVQFSPLTLPETGATRGVVRISDDALAIDNSFHFVLSADQRIGVLVVDGAGSNPETSYFLERALEIGSSPGFRAEVRRAGEIRAVDLAANSVVVLNQTGVPGGEQGARLREFVQQGGGLVLVVGENGLGEWPDVLPIAGAPLDRSGGGGTTLGYVDIGHPVFEPFAGPRTGDFSAARVYRYRPLPSGSFPRVLARFGDGGAALVENPVGDGRVLLWTSTLDGSWNDLTVQPIFLPFLHQLVKYASGYAPPRNWMTVGEPFDFSTVSRTGAAGSVAVSPSGRRIPVEPGVLLELDEAGFYELGDARVDAAVTSFAVNIDPAESSLVSLDPEQIRGALLAAAVSEAPVASSTELTLAERERQQSGWWYLMVAAFLLLIAETLFSNRGLLGRSASVRSGGAKGGGDRTPGWAS